MKKSFVVTLIALVGLVACDKDYNTIGSNLVNNRNYQLKKHSIENIKMYSGETESVQSNNLPVNSLGVFTDDFFGTQISSFVTQVELETTNPTIGESVEIQDVDSVYLYVPYFVNSSKTYTDTFGNRTFDLDSILPRTGYSDLSFDLKIYENKYFLSSVDPGNPSIGQQYFSNQKGLVESDLGSQLNTSTDIYENSEFKVSSKEHIIYKTDGAGNWLDFDGNVTTDLNFRVAKERFEPGMWINLDKDFFKDNILLAGESNLLSNSNFKQYFKGLYFQATQNATDGVLAQLDFSKGYVVIQYHSKLDATSDLEKRSLKLKLTGNKINFFEKNPSASYSNAISNSDVILGSEIVPIKGNNGASAFIELFKVDNPGVDDLDNNGIHDQLDELIANNWLINDAILTVYIADEGQVNANRLYLYNAKENKLIVDYSLDPSEASVPNFSKYEFGGIIEKDASGLKKYRFRLANYIRNLLKSDDSATLSDIKLGLVVTEDISNSSFANLEEKTTMSGINDFYVDDLIPVGSVMNPLGTVLYGNLEVLGKEDKKIKLEIYYTEPN